MDNSKLYVGNLPFASTAQDLEALFGQVGTVSVVEIIFDKFTGRSRGFAFVTMTTGDEAQKAVEKFHGFQMDGRLRRIIDAASTEGAGDLPPGVRPPVQFAHADTLIDVSVRVSGAGGRYPSALCGRCVL